MKKTKLDMPRIGEVRYCSEKKAHVLIKDLILGNGICDAIVYYIRDRVTERVPANSLKKNKNSYTSLNKLKATTRGASLLYPYTTLASGHPGIHHAYKPTSSWDELSKTKKACNCEMIPLLRYGCKCGGV